MQATGVDICSENTISAEDFEEDLEIFDETQATTNINNDIKRNWIKDDAYFDFSSDDDNELKNGNNDEMMARHNRRKGIQFAK